MKWKERRMLQTKNKKKFIISRIKKRFSINTTRFFSTLMMFRYEVSVDGK